MRNDEIIIHSDIRIEGHDGSLLALTDLAPHLPVLDSANVLADGAVVAWEPLPCDNMEPEPPEPEVLVAASVPSNDLYAPPKRFCGDKGDCDKLPHEVRIEGHDGSR